MVCKLQQGISCWPEQLLLPRLYHEAPGLTWLGEVSPNGA